MKGGEMKSLLLYKFVENFRKQFVVFFCISDVGENLGEIFFPVFSDIFFVDIQGFFLGMDFFDLLSGIV